MTKKIPPPWPSGNPESTPIGFLYVPSDLFNDFSLSLEEERILAIVRSYNGSCYWTEERFAEFCRCSTRTIIRVIKTLEERGRLRKESRGNQSNLYSEIPSDAQSSIVTNCHDDKMSHPYCQNVTSIVTNCHDDSDKLSPYIDIYNTKNKDNDNTEIVADAPTPTCEYPLTLEEPQDSEVVQESDSLEKPIEISEAPPIPAAPPEKQKTKKRKEPSGRKVPFPSPEYWAEKRPDLIDWAKKWGALGTDEQIGRWVDERLAKLEGAAISKDMKYSSWSQTFQNFYQHLIPTQLKKAFDGLVLAANDKNRFHDIWDKAPSAKKFGFESEGVEAYRDRLKNYYEDSKEGRALLEQFIKTVGGNKNGK